MCSICGQPGYVRCNCQSAQPFCDQCQGDTVCAEFFDTACVIYHFATPTYIPPATKLINLNLPNGSSAQTIFEAIDSALGFAKPWVPADTSSIHLYTAGLGLPIVLKGDVKISATSGNTISINPDGIYSPTPSNSGQVKVDSISPLRYLINSVVGGTDGCVTIDIVDQSGLMAILPTLDVTCLAGVICAAPTNVKQELMACLMTDGLIVQDTPTLDLDISNFPIVLSGDVKISASGGNTIVANGDGIYSSGGTGFTITNNANGNLITANGTSNSASGQPTLTYLSGTLSAPTFIYNMLVTASQEFDRILGSSNIVFGSASYGNKASNITGVHSQLFVTPTVGPTFGRGHFIGGSISELVPNDNTGTSVSGLLAASIAKISIFGNNNYSDIASIRTSYPGTDVIFSGTYSGTITNYYGLFIGDTNSNEGGIAHASVTNSYAIFQEGSTLLNSFATAVVVTSDARVKTNIEDYNGGLDIIEKIDTVKYHFKEKAFGDKRVGVLAQDIEKVLPEAVHTERNDFYGIEDFKKIDTDTLVYTLINAVKELSKQNKDLKAKLNNHILGY